MFLTRWLAPTNTAAPKTPAEKSQLNLETLEARENPASLNIQFDYRFDNGYFTSTTDPNAALRRATLEQAGRDLGSRITTPLAGLQATGGNSWSAVIFNPSNPNQQVSIPNLVVPANTIIVFASGGAGSGGEAGLGGYGGYSASGTQSWLNQLSARGPGGFSLWGGAVSFDPNQNWNYTLNPPASNQLDFYTVSVHELAHVLGFGTAPTWNNRVVNGTYQGQYSAFMYGAAPPVSITNPGHWQQGMTWYGEVSVMQPYLSHGKRLTFSNLDYAALADMGWQVSGINAAVPAPVSPPPAPVVPPPPPPLVIQSTPQPTNPITGSRNSPETFGISAVPGNVEIYTAANGTLTSITTAFNPFPGYTGPIRTAMGDVNGDGRTDIIVSMGAGIGPLVRVFDGVSGALINEFFAFEANFTGGVFVATADFNNDGRDDIIVAADRTGGPRVRVLDGGNPAIVLTDFFGIEDPAFKGGVRVAAGDINGDGVPDLVVAAGVGGGPRVSIYDGRSLSMFAPPRRLTGDFFAFELTLTNGSYVAVGDINGDGFDDVILGAGEGGGPRVKVLSGQILTQADPTTALAYTLKDYFIGDARSGSGVRVASFDVNGDGVDEIIAGSGINSSARVFIDGLNWSTSYSLAGGMMLRNGVFVG